MTASAALVTGITGQDGGYLAEQLVGDGISVHGIVRPGESPPVHLRACGDGVQLHALELADRAGLARLLLELSPAVVYNLVGLSVAQSWSDPALAGEVNGIFVARLLHLLWDQQERTGSPVRLVQASSAEIFAGSVGAPQDEQTPMSPRSPYGASKAFAHGLVQVFRSRGMHASNAILYNHESPRRPTSFVTRKITSTSPPSPRDGRSSLSWEIDARRDWGWAPEYVDAMVRMAHCEVADDYVVATGESHNVEEFVAAAFLAVGIEDWRSRVRVDPAFVRPVDAVDLRGDPSRASRVLGWVPQTRFPRLVALMVEADRSAG